MGLVGRNVGDRNGQWKGDDVGIDGCSSSLNDWRQDVKKRG